MIFWQSFIINTYGSIENAAFLIYFEEIESNDLIFKRMEIGFRKKKFLENVPNKIKFHLSKYEEWFQYIETYRHSLAHRIPPYIPPFCIDPEDAERHSIIQGEKRGAIFRKDIIAYDKLKEEEIMMRSFKPFLIHSENNTMQSIPVHGQILADFATVEELSNLVYDVIK